MQRQIIIVNIARCGLGKDVVSCASPSREAEGLDTLRRTSCASEM